VTFSLKSSDSPIFRELVHNFYITTTKIIDMI